MNISERIDQIIAKRKSKVSILEDQKKRCNEIRERVAEFERFKSMIRINPEKFTALQGNNDIINEIAFISTDDFHAAFNSYMAKLDQMIRRLSRDNLNISFVGRAGQGKSLVMQRISGLDGNIIPSSDGSDCTGTKSVIHNCSGSQVVAKINFFSEYEMVENVNKYLDKISNGSNVRIERISSASEIQNINVAAIRSGIPMEDVESKSLVEHLTKYVEHYSVYAPHLGKTVTVSASEIERYVAQYKNGNPSEKYFLYLGVKFADIMCEFPHSDTGKIELVDTIGIGATSLATEEKMLDTVENDSDAILFMFRPDPCRPRISSDEIDIIKKISTRVSPEYSKEMLFWIVNRVDSGKGENKALLPEIVAKAEQGDYPVAKVLNVNCFLDDEVEHKLLVPVLEQLTSRIENVDKMLIEKLNKFADDLYFAYHRICNGAEKALASSASEDMKHQFNRKIKTTYQMNLLDKLKDIFKRYAELRTQPCEDFEKASTGKLKNITLNVPKKDIVIESLAYAEDQVSAYKNWLNIMRKNIIDDFNELNNVFDAMVESMKKEVLHIFADEDKGRLGFIKSLDDKAPSSEWINDFLEKTNAKEEYPVLDDALRKFNKYSIDVQGFLIPKVRNQLDLIDPALNGGMETINGKSKDEQADDIIELLNDKAYRIRENIKHELVDLSSAPHLSMFAAIADLHDRLNYARDNAGGEQIDTKEQWRYLYENWMHLIWKDEYEAKSGLVSVAKQWNDLISKLKEMDDQKSFVISQY